MLPRVHHLSRLLYPLLSYGGHEVNFDLVFRMRYMPPYTRERNGFEVVSHKYTRSVNRILKSSVNIFFRAVCHVHEEYENNRVTAQ